MTEPRKRLFSLLAASLALFLAVWVLPTSLPAQVAIPSSALSDMTDVQQALRRGEEFEKEQRWGEALLHYEQAVKSHPESSQLEQRLTLARIHYDLTRRYNDKSFIDSLGKLTQHQALDVYSEVMRKIQSHYVQSPNWQQLVQWGATQLDVALNEPVFVQRHIPNASSQQITAFRSELSRLVASQSARNRHDARALVHRVAYNANRKLQLSPNAVIFEFTSGATSALDNYSSFLTPNQLDEIFSQIEGNFVGLGIELKLETDALLIVSVISGGPAEQAGLRPEDRIVAIDGKATSALGAEAAADRLKGPEGSQVRLSLRNSEGAVRDVQVARKRVDVPSVEDVKLVDRQLGVGYLKLTSFQKTTSRDVDAALWKLYRQGMRSLIVDVRGNPGGLLSAAVEVADKFVTDGTLVSTRGRSQQEDYDYQARRVGTWRVPLVVLIDGDSASASEIFAAAIHDHRRGTVVGQRSYGKGSVQGIFPLAGSGAGVRLTTAKFFAPTGRAISRQGVDPHVVVQEVAKASVKPTEPPKSNGDDPALQSGLRVARSLIARR